MLILWVFFCFLLISNLDFKFHCGGSMETSRTSSDHREVHSESLWVGTEFKFHRGMEVLKSPGWFCKSASQAESTILGKLGVNLEEFPP